MLTGLPERSYRHQDIAKLVWPYFSKQNIHTLYYNVIVLPLERRVRSRNIIFTGANNILIEMSVILSSSWIFFTSVLGLCVFSWLDCVLWFCQRPHHTSSVSHRLSIECPFCDATYGSRTKWGKDTSNSGLKCKEVGDSVKISFCNYPGFFCLGQFYMLSITKDLMVQYQ